MQNALTWVVTPADHIPSLNQYGGETNIVGQLVDGAVTAAKWGLIFTVATPLMIAGAIMAPVLWLSFMPFIAVASVLFPYPPFSPPSSVLEATVRISMTFIGGLLMTLMMPTLGAALGFGIFFFPLAPILFPDDPYFNPIP